MRPFMLALVLVAAAASGQDKPAQTSVPPPPGGAADQAPAYNYNPEGRRDPFISLLRRVGDPNRPPGKAVGDVSGFLLSEIVLKGIMQSRDTHVALVLGPDTKTYMVRVTDRLLDGVVRAITADTLVVLQDVNDPLSLTKQREVRRTLRSAVEAK
jgi:type IV pilus assembly protein PilP